MLKCYDCNRTFESDALKIVPESRGEFWGTPAYENMYYCPFCGGSDFDECNEEDEERERILESPDEFYESVDKAVDDALNHRAQEYGIAPAVFMKVEKVVLTLHPELYENEAGWKEFIL